MAKRLRGWQMELESGRIPDRNSSKQELPWKRQSLANKLLMLWAHGLLSAVMIRELADLAIADGASHPDLVALAPTGNWGAQTGNCNRQILNAFCPQVHLPEPFQIKVGCIDPKTSLEKEDMASVFLPHLQFYMLAEHYPSYFHELFSLGKGDLEKFWAGVEKSGDDKIINHPMCLEKPWRETTIPLFIHGGGVEFQSRDSLLVFSWGGVLGKGTSLKHHQLMAMWPKSCCTASTWGPIWQYLKWSFEALGKGLHPSKDPLGNPLEKGSIFYELQGKPLHAKGFRAYVWNIMGDHEFFSNVLGLPHWAGHFPCWECDSENWEGCNPDKHFKQICLEKQKFEVTSHQDQMADPWSDHPIFQLPHLSCKNVRGDPMHILFCKGLYQQLIGGILHYACYYEGPGKVTSKKPWERLALLFSAVQEEYRAQNLDNRMTNLKLSMLTNPKKPWAARACLECKAGEAKHLLSALVPVLEKIWAESMHEQEIKMISAASSLEKLVKLWDEAATFLKDSEFKRSMTLGKEFLDSYRWLSSWSLEKDRNSFGIVAKHHTFIHLLWNSKHLNPRVAWCFRGEDFVGHISKMTHSVSHGVSSTKLTQKICQKYRVLLHFLITRNMEVDSPGRLSEDTWEEWSIPCLRKDAWTPESTVLEKASACPAVLQILGKDFCRTAVQRSANLGKDLSQMYMHRFANLGRDLYLKKSCLYRSTAIVHKATKCWNIDLHIDWLIDFFIDFSIDLMVIKCMFFLLILCLQKSIWNIDFADIKINIILILINMRCSGFQKSHREIRHRWKLPRR